MKTSPLLSLCLLAIAYSIFSWFLHDSVIPTCARELLIGPTQGEFFKHLLCSRAPWLVWLVITLFALLQALLLTTLSIGFRRFINRWLGSDIGYFSIITLSAMSIAFIMLWLHLFTYVLVTISAEILARLDLQNAGFNRWQSLGILTSTSMIGLAIGWGAQYLPLS